MKKTILILVLAMLTSLSYGQKKKGSSKSKATAGALAKTDNLTAEVVKNEFHLYVNEAGKKDLLFSRPVDANKKLSDVKITGFKTKNIPMYCITWTEKGTTKTDLKTENATRIVSEIWEVPSKTQMIGNTQTTTHIVEKVFLDRLKNASETQEKMRREGYEFTLLPDGDFILKDKKSETKYTYNDADKKYVSAVAGKKKK